jgi:hypothetical protein
MAPRKHPSAALWLTVALVVVLVAYPLSFGPACWWFSSEISTFDAKPPVRRAPRAYFPIGWLAQHGPQPVGDAIFWYATFYNDSILLPTNMAGSEWYDSGVHFLLRLLR